MSYRELGRDSMEVYVQQGSAGDRVQLMRALFPRLAADIDDALEEHGAVEQGVAFDTWLDDRARELRGSFGFDTIEDPEIAARLHSSFAASRALARLVGVEPPEPEAFPAAGVDLEFLERQLVSDPGLVPVVAVYGLGAEGWERVFASDEAGHTSLVIAGEALREFATLDSRPSGVSHVAHDSLVWTLRLIPGGIKPAVLGLAYSHGPHVTLPEILTMQFMRLWNGEAPLDPSSFTWLAGPLADGRLAARHVFDAGERTIRITCREVGSQGPHLGARSPIS